MHKKIILLLALLCVVFLFSSCTPKEKVAVQELTEVTVVLDWFPNTNHTGLYVAKEEGFYEKQGLDVKIIQPSESGASQLVAAEKAQFGVSYQEEVTNARAENVPIKAVAAIIQHNTSGFAAPVAKGIKSPKDFAGKKYGGWGSPSESAMIKALTDKYDADFSQVEFVNMGTADFFTSVKKDIDFAWIFYGWTGIEAELRGEKLDYISLREEVPALDFYTPVLIIADNLEKENPELIKKFLKATTEGYMLAEKDPAKAAEIFLTAVPEQNKDLVKASQVFLSKEYRGDASVWGEMEEKRWKDYADWMYEQGLIKNNIDSQDAFTNDYLPKE